jgi:isochorismate synthase
LAELAHEHASSARQRARDLDHPVLLSLSIPTAVPEDPLVLIEGATPEDGYAFLWQQPAADFALTGIGAIAVSVGNGSSRFTTVAESCNRVVEDAIIAVSGEVERPGPFFVGGFAFSPNIGTTSNWEAFPAGCMILPRSHVIRCGSSATLTLNVMVQPNSAPDAVARAITEELARLREPASPSSRTVSVGQAVPANPSCRTAGTARPTPNHTVEVQNVGTSRSPLVRGNNGAVRVEGRPEWPIGEGSTVTPDDAAWRRAVLQTISDIRTGRLDKLVLARECRVSSGVEVDPGRLLQRLRHAYPTCTNFLFRTPGGVFLGATPERLVALDNGNVRTAALAGSIARSDSKTKDRELGYRLLHDHKERREHALVVKAIEEALAPLCSRLDVTAEPDLLRLENVQHLITPISGGLSHSCGILDLVARLHPSPAVGGYPRAAALEALREREDIERGWYAGPVGWMDAQGNGDFAVAVRSALVHGTCVTLCAGAGIVAGSDPDVELAEVRLKMQPILSALADKSTTTATAMSNQRLAS